MKKLFFLFIILLLASCEKADDGFLKMNSSDIFMFHDSNFQLSHTTNLDLTWQYSSSNEDVITVNQGGWVEGVRIGRATVTISSVKGDYKDSCVFNIIPRSNLYREPLLVMGADSAAIMNYENRNYTPEDSHTGRMSFFDNEKGIWVVYFLDNDSLHQIIVVVNPEQRWEADIYLKERYPLVTETMYNTKGIGIWRDNSFIIYE